MPARHDRGAAAVEFALVLPLLILLTLGIVAFGYAFHIQTTLDNAARDAVRVAALDTSEHWFDNARQAGVDAAAPSITIEREDVDLDIGGVAIGPGARCDMGADIRATITLTDFELLGGFGSIDLSGTGTMRCIG